MNDNEILQAAKEIKEKEARRKKQEYNKNYIKNNTINKGIQLNKEIDKDIITFISGLEKPFNKYIKELIRKDIKEKQKKEV